MIRWATADDMPRMVSMGRNFLNYFPQYKEYIPADVARLEQFFSRLLLEQDALCLVLGEPGDAHGMIGAMPMIHPFSGVPTGAELFWWVEPDRRGRGISLLKHLIAWSKHIEAKHIQVVSPSKKVSRVYRKLGFRHFEQTFVMKVS